MDMLCLLPLDLLYLKFGVSPLLRLPRCLKVGFPSGALSYPVLCSGIWLSALSSTGEQGQSGGASGWPRGDRKFLKSVRASSLCCVLGIIPEAL